ncbi:MAG: trimethylamine methyltransferase family protein, partial [Hyphomicrobiaceae bacterium]
MDNNAGPITRSGRRGMGRAARVAARSAGLGEDERPVRPGLEGGHYRPLSDDQAKRIHTAALDALEQIGLADAPPSGVALLTGVGAELGDDGRIRFPRSLVEDMLAVAARDITLHGRETKFDLTLSGKRVHYGTAGAAVHLVDVENREYRECTTQDLFNAARLTQALDNVHFFQRPMVCRDVTDNLSLDINTIFASCAGTTKHIGTSFCEPATVAECIELLHIIAGGEDNWRARPFVSNTNCFVVPPMKFASESCETMEHCVRAGMPILLLSAGQAGATAPAPLAAAIVQAVAECLA